MIGKKRVEQNYNIHYQMFSWFNQEGINLLPVKKLF